MTVLGRGWFVGLSLYQPLFRAASSPGRAPASCAPASSAANPPAPPARVLGTASTSESLQNLTLSNQRLARSVTRIGPKGHTYTTLRSRRSQQVKSRNISLDLRPNILFIL